MMGVLPLALKKDMVGLHTPLHLHLRKLSLHLAVCFGSAEVRGIVDQVRSELFPQLLIHFAPPRKPVHAFTSSPGSNSNAPKFFTSHPKASSAFVNRFFSSKPPWSAAIPRRIMCFLQILRSALRAQRFHLGHNGLLGNTFEIEELCRFAALGIMHDMNYKELCSSFHLLCFQKNYTIRCLVVQSKHAGSTADVFADLTVDAQGNWRCRAISPADPERIARQPQIE